RERPERPREPRLLPELAPRGLERRLARLDLTADRQPRGEPAVLDDQHTVPAPRIDCHRERPAPTIGHGKTSKSIALDERSLTITINTVVPTGATGGITICALVSE